MLFRCGFPAKLVLGIVGVGGMKSALYVNSVLRIGCI